MRISQTERTPPATVAGSTNTPSRLQSTPNRLIKLISLARNEMTTLRERQIHMTQLLKKLDRMIVEKHGKFNFPFYHYQKPLAAPGERDSVCVYIDAVKREYLPYGVELEKMVEEARLWVRNGEGTRPEVLIMDQAIKPIPETEAVAPGGIAESSEEDVAESTDRSRALRGAARRKILGLRTGSRPA